MNRRQFLYATGMTAGGVVSGCYKRQPRAFSPIPGINCNLAPVIVSPDREIRTVVGLRPYRPSGFVVKTEKLDDKLVIHNYGHGGAGITLSWGTAQLAAALLPGEPVSSVAVLGCGAVGLATARLLQERGLPVTIYAAELPPNTTSNIAGGEWFPIRVVDPDKRTPEFMSQFLQAAEFAYRRYQILVGPRYGVRWLRNFALGHDPYSENALVSAIRPLLPEIRDLSDSEHPFSGYPFVRQYDSMLIESPIYLSATLTDFRIAGGTVRVRHFDNVSQLQQLTEPVIFNCTGLGARALFDDQELIPAKGQLTFLLPQPEVNYLMGTDDSLYMFPRSDGILLGGTFEKGEWSLSVNETAKARVLQGHARLFGGFRRCQRAALDFQRPRVLRANHSQLAV